MISRWCRAMPHVKNSEMRVPLGASSAVMSATSASGQKSTGSARTTRWNTIAWGLLGFFCGALFWHVVGFWDFLGGIVYKQHRDTTIIERVLTTQFAEAEEDKPLAAREKQARAAAQNCTTLVMDRISGATAARPCVVIIRNVPLDAELAQASNILTTSARLDRVAAGR